MLKLDTVGVYQLISDDMQTTEVKCSFSQMCSQVFTKLKSLYYLIFSITLRVLNTIFRSVSIQRL